MNYRKLVGEKVYLSPVSSDDWESYAAWGADVETMTFVGGGNSIKPPAEGPESLDWQVKQNNVFSIVDIETDKVIGDCGFYYEDIANRYAKIGITIGIKTYWSKGFGTDAIRLLLDFGFNTRGYNNISLNVYEFNKRGIACYEKLGFKRQGLWRESMIRGQKRYDCIHMDLLASEYFILRNEKKIAFRSTVGCSTIENNERSLNG